MSAADAGQAAFAPAKVNLALHVTGRRSDGYHELDSLVAFAAIGDELRLRPAADFSLTVRGPFAAAVPAGPDNLAWRAARAAVARWPEAFAPLAITLTKNLPAAAGLGGGSADAAAVLRAMSAIANRPPPPRDLAALALSLGADVPACLHARAARMRGIGGIVTPLAGWPDMPAVLANPGLAVPTAEVFAALEDVPGRPLPPLPARLSREEAMRWLARTGNDLQAAAVARRPVIGHCLRELAALPGCRLARMTGSGATCFALFDDAAAARAAARRLQARHAGWWVEATILS